MGLKLKRLEPGRYRTADGRVEIVREVSQCTGHADEVVWTVFIDGRINGISWETKREAVNAAERRLLAGTIVRKELCGGQE